MRRVIAMSRRVLAFSISFMLLQFTAFLTAPPVDARITKIVLDAANSQSPIFSGITFSGSGQYEKIAGRAYGEVDPHDRKNSVIVDIRNAPRNPATGMVEYSVNFVLLKPTAISNGNDRVFALIPNRGSPNGLSNMVGGTFPTVRYTTNMTNQSPGNAFLMKLGYSILMMGWDVSADKTDPSRYSIDTPIATRHGDPIVGPSLEEFIIDNDTTTQSGAFQYPAADSSNSTSNKRKAKLSYRVLQEDHPKYLHSSDWEYVDDRHVRLLPAGTPFKRGLYEFVYPATDPLVAGIGLAAMRDVMSWFKYESQDTQSPPTANPLWQHVDYIYTHCSSQPCRTMHDYTYLGFNRDENNRQVVDGVLNWIAAGNFLKLNYRFSNAGRTHRQHINRWYPEFEFPFSNLVYKDRVTHKTDGKFKRCLATDTCPKWFEVFSENEYSAKAGSTTHFDGTLGDLPDPPHTRLYLMASLPHGATADTNPGNCQQNRNPLQPYSVLRALLVDLDEWVTDGIKPPASRVPRRYNHTLVPALPQAKTGFPNIPARPPVTDATNFVLDQGLAVKYNGRTHRGNLLDYGPRYESHGIVDHWPPIVKRQSYAVMVPKTDADGNNIAGIRLPEVSVPTATYTGWALRANLPGYDTEETRGDADGCDASGQKIMFRATKTGREAIGDPRLSIEERYAGRDDFIAKVTAAANELKSQRLMLQEDVDTYISGAGAMYDQALLATP